MKERILYGWNFQRVTFISVGTYMMVQAIARHEWPAAMVGGYFASMGLLALGCAAGNCQARTCVSVTEKKDEEKAE